jgi:RNA polymerase sigma-70 factor (ECF subfamily)
MEDARRDFWAQKFSEYRSALNRYFRRRVSTQEDAEDLAQEVYLRLLRTDHGEGGAIRNPEAYLYTVAVNLLRERAALASRRGEAVNLDEVDERLLGAETSPADAYENTERDARVDAAVNAHPAKLRAEIVKHYLHDQSHQDMAKALGVTTSATRKYVGQALQLCRRRLRSTP